MTPRQTRCFGSSRFIFIFQPINSPGYGPENDEARFAELPSRLARLIESSVYLSPRLEAAEQVVGQVQVPVDLVHIPWMGDKPAIEEAPEDLVPELAAEPVVAVVEEDGRDGFEEDPILDWPPAHGLGKEVPRLGRVVLTWFCVQVAYGEDVVLDGAMI